MLLNRGRRFEPRHGDWLLLLKVFKCVVETVTIIRVIFLVEAKVTFLMEVKVTFCDGGQGNSF